MVTERLPFSYFHGNKCYGNKFLHQNHPTYQSKLSQKSGMNQIKTTQKKLSWILYLVPKVTDPSNRANMHQRLFAWTFSIIFHYIVEWF